MNDVEEEKYLGFHKKNQHIHMPGLSASIFIMEHYSVLQNSPAMCQACA